jgi:hypothetical protein
MYLKLKPLPLAGASIIVYSTQTAFAVSVSSLSVLLQLPVATFTPNGLERLECARCY